MQNSAPLIVDSFAGGGGASTGIEMALGRSPDIAINHNADALALHAANHPETLHLSENIFKVDPLDHVAGKHVGLAWFSPDCKHFSKAKGGKPVERNIRDLAWVIVLWAQRAKPDVIIMENVEEWKEWGPLIETDKGLMPCPDSRGQTFQKWCKAMKAAGYKLQHRELRACDYGAPTIRKRLFVIARRDGKPIVWPEPTHGAPTDRDVISGQKRPWRTAAEIIDWSLPCPSIFDTSSEIMGKFGLRAIRPLADATMARVARGDFLIPGMIPWDDGRGVDWIITNPPFRLAEQFIARALDVAINGVAMIVRTSFLEGVGRYQNLFSTNPPSIVAQFSERVPMVKGKLTATGSTATSYCWLVWIKGATGTKLVWIPPCRKKLERQEDYAAYREVAA